MSFGKVFVFLSGLSLGYFLTNLKGTVMNDYLYLFVGIVGGYFLFNFIPYYFTAEEVAKPTLTEPGVAMGGGGEPPKEITVMSETSRLDNPIQRGTIDLTATPAQTTLNVPAPACSLPLSTLNSQSTVAPVVLSPVTPVLNKPYTTSGLGVSGVTTDLGLLNSGQNLNT